MELYGTPLSFAQTVEIAAGLEEIREILMNHFDALLVLTETWLCFGKHTFQDSRGFENKMLDVIESETSSRQDQL